MYHMRGWLHLILVAMNAHSLVDHLVVGVGGWLSLLAVIVNFIGISIGVFAFGSTRASICWAIQFGSYSFFHVLKSAMGVAGGCGCLASVDPHAGLVFVSAVLITSCCVLDSIETRFQSTSLALCLAGVAFFYTGAFLGVQKVCPLECEVVTSLGNGIIERDTIKIDLELKAKSRRTISINKVIASCNCTQISSSPRSVSHSHPERISLQVDLSKYRASFDRHDHAKVEIAVAIHCEHGVFSKPISFELNRLVESDGRMRFIREPSGGNFFAKLHFSKPLLKVVTDDPAIEVNIEDSEVSLRSTTAPNGKITLDGNLLTGEYFGPITFRVEH